MIRLYSFIYSLPLSIAAYVDQATMQRVLFGQGNREGTNEYLDPVILQGVRQLVGEDLALNMTELIQTWLRDATVGGLRLRSVDGTAVVRRPRISQASDNCFYSDHTQPGCGSMATPNVVQPDCLR